VTGYTVRAYPSATSGRPASTCIVTVATRNCVLGGLTNDRTYYVAVVAANAAGVGPASERTTGTPRHPPS
jgi:Fibronectin type III domain